MRAAPALRSQAFTGAPMSLPLPSMRATLPLTVISAPILLSSSTYLKRCSQIFSVMMLVPSASVKRVAICDCISVGKPGCGAVLTLVLTRGPSTHTLMLSSNCCIFTPIFSSFFVIDSRCLGITFFMRTSPFVAATATIKVPASIWSGITEYVVPWRYLTPFIFITSVPAPMIFAPIALRKLAKSTIWGSFAAFSITVRPSALTAASIAFIVAPTVTTSKNIWFPSSLSALRSTIP